MRPHPRIRRTVKWGGAAASVFVIALWAASLLVDVTVDMDDHTQCALSPGSLTLRHDGYIGTTSTCSGLLSGNGPPVHTAALGAGRLITCVGPPAGPLTERVVAMTWVPRWVHGPRSIGTPLIPGSFPSVQLTGFWDIIIHLWLPLAITAGFALHAHRNLIRVAAQGLCPNCSYSRTGLAPSAVCPECGAPAPDRA